MPKKIEKEKEKEKEKKEKIVNYLADKIVSWRCKSPVDKFLTIFKIVLCISAAIALLILVNV